MLGCGEPGLILQDKVRVKMQRRRWYHPQARCGLRVWGWGPPSATDPPAGGPGDGSNRRALIWGLCSEVRYTGPPPPWGGVGQAGAGAEDWRGGRGEERGGKRRAEREGGGESQPADAAAQIKLLPVVNFIHEVVDQNVI